MSDRSKFISREADGADAIGFELVTAEALVTDGSAVLKLASQLLDVLKVRRGTGMLALGNSMVSEWFDNAGDLGFQLEVVDPGTASRVALEIPKEQLRIDVTDGTSYANMIIDRTSPVGFTYSLEDTATGMIGISDFISNQSSWYHENAAGDFATCTMVCGGGGHDLYEELATGAFGQLLTNATAGQWYHENATGDYSRFDLTADGWDLYSLDATTGYETDVEISKYYVTLCNTAATGDYTEIWFDGSQFLLTSSNSLYTDYSLICTSNHTGSPLNGSYTYWERSIPGTPGDNVFLGLHEDCAVAGLCAPGGVEDRFTLLSLASNVATTEAFEFDTDNDITNVAAKLVTWKSDGALKAAIDYAGNIVSDQPLVYKRAVVTLDYTDFAAAAFDNTVTLFALPAKAVVRDVYANCTTPMGTPVVTHNATVDGTAGGIITVASSTGFSNGNYINVVDDDTGAAQGYIVSITDMGGGAIEIHVQDLPSGGSDVNLISYTVVENARIYLDSSACVMEVGIAGDTDKYIASAADIYTAAADFTSDTDKGSALTTSGLTNVESFTVPTNLVVKVDATGSLLNQFTTGSVDFYIEYSEVR